MEIISLSGSKRTAYGWASGDNPGNPDFHHAVPDDVAGPIARCVEELQPASGEVISVRALQPCTHVVGRFHVVTQRGEWFVRVSSFKGHPKLEKDITQYLSDEGVSVARWEFTGHALEWNGSSYRLDLRVFLHGRHFNGSDEDLGRTAQLLKACHEALKKFPAAGQVRELAHERWTKLDAARHRLARMLKEGQIEKITPYAEWNCGQAQWLDGLVSNFSPGYDLLPNAQCLHGQPHRANVVYHLDHGGPVLLDFEEAVSVWAPPAWDLAYFIQRFCFHGVTDELEIRRRLDLVAKNYGRFGGEVFEMMRQISWLSIVTLVDAWTASQVEAPLAEYEKFVALEQQACAAKKSWE